MSKTDLPGEQVINNAFKERGREGVVMIDVFPVCDGELLKLTFEDVNSPWRQGVWMKADDHLIVNGQRCPSVELWQGTAPMEVFVECHTRNGRLHLYNIWDKGNGSNSQSWTSGMLVEELPNGRRYRCNDIGFDSNFEKLVFRVERG
jgi:hypothetical protein